MAGKESGSKRTARKRQASDEAVSYDEFKMYEGQRYTGMKIGRTHSWNYDPGRWKEKKITPDLWQINYAVTKRRAGRAPEGSGVPVGTEYHWYILAHQNVEKLNANDYTTSLAGLKFKIAHRRADSGKWSTTPRTQRRRMIRFLRDVIEDLEKGESGSGADASLAKRAAGAKEASAAKRSSAAAKSSDDITRASAAEKSSGSRNGSAAQKSSPAKESRARKRPSSRKRAAAGKKSAAQARRRH